MFKASSNPLNALLTFCVCYSSNEAKNIIYRVFMAKWKAVMHIFCSLVRCFVGQNDGSGNC